MVFKAEQAVLKLPLPTTRMFADRHGEAPNTLGTPTLGALRSRGWMHRVISLVEAAVDQLDDQGHQAQRALLEAAVILRQQIYPLGAAVLSDRRENLETPASLGCRPLSSREKSILQMIAHGMTNKRIALSLGIAPETVKSHAKNIFVKLATNTRAQAVARAESIGFL